MTAGNNEDVIKNDVCVLKLQNTINSVVMVFDFKVAYLSHLDLWQVLNLVKGPLNSP